MLHRTAAASVLLYHIMLWYLWHAFGMHPREFFAPIMGG